MESSFCSVCKQVVIDKPMTHHFSCQDHFAKVFTLMRKTFCSCVFCDIYVYKGNKETMKVQEIIFKLTKFTLVVTVELLVFVQF